MSKLAPINYYDKACRAVAKARSVDELHKIRIEAVAFEAAARMAKNKDMESDAVAIRLRATRQLGLMMEAQDATVELASGAEHGGRRKRIDGVRKTPSIVRPTLAMQGVDKNLAKQARTLRALPPERFEAVIDDTRNKVNRAVRNAVREVEIEAQRGVYRARTYQGGRVEDLEALAASGARFGVIYVDVPSAYETYSGKGKQRTAERHYDTMGVDELKAMGPLIQRLAAEHCALMYWTSGPQNAAALDIIRSWDFDYTTWAFVWIKTKPSRGVVELEQLSHTDLDMGMGYGSRANAEVVLQATRGEPLRLAANVHQIVIAPTGEHSEKPEEVARRIERLYPGPYLELFSRKERANWIVWGNEIVATKSVRAAIGGAP